MTSTDTLQRRRPSFDRDAGDRVSATWPHAVMRANERARERGVRQLVSRSPYNEFGQWWRIQDAR